jgi:predicted component of type VI protein secretion system
MPYIEFGQQSRALGPGVLSIGSGAEAGWRIRDQGLARLHALVVVERDGRVVISRGAPDAPLAVNGVELEEEGQVLRFGDTMQLGAAEFAYVESSHQASDPNEGYLRDTRRDRLYRLREENDIGRDVASSILLQEPEVSRHHAEVRFDGTGFALVPKVGAVTLLNGQRLMAPTKLSDGDMVTVGRTTMRFSTSLPPNSALEEGLRHRADRRVAQMPTTFMNVFESRQRIKRRSRRRAGRVAVMAIIAAALIAGVVTAYERSLASTRDAATADSTISRSAAGRIDAPVGTAPAPR